MKVAAAVPRVRVADCDFNASEIIRCVNEAVSMEVQVIVFPELCITGYSCGDLFFQETLLHGAVQSLRQIADATLLQDIIVIVGMPLAVESLLLNTAVVLQRGRMLGVVSKSYLPNYREFQEKRWFVSACCCDVKETILISSSFHWEMIWCSVLLRETSASSFAKTFGHRFHPVPVWP